MRLGIAGKVGYAVACMASAITLVVAGYAHEVVGLTDQLGEGVGLGDGPSTGAMNILVMGLESRTTFQGQNLSVQQLTETHSGKESQVAAGLEGSQDTDTLILIHIFAGGQKAVGFSIPRDDVVNYPHATYDGLTEGKIDAAYAYAYDQSMQQTAGDSLSTAQRALEANQAGQLFEVQTVESVTGVHIDHFIDSNIIGFYEMSKQLGGLEICIQPAPASVETDGFGYGGNLVDLPYPGAPFSQSNSGFDAFADGYDGKKGGKQYLHLSSAQSLAYVRARDSLPGVDIGRTARQQAAIEYILWDLKTKGVLGDLGEMTSLLAGAQSYLMYDSGWNLIDFAQDMRALSGSHLDFTTLPEISTNNVSIPGYDGLQSANYIDEPQIQQAVSEAFYGTPMIPGTAGQVTVDVYNGSGTAGLAGSVTQDLAAMGYKTGTPEDSSSQSQQVQDGTQVFYGAGSAAEANAKTIANVLGVQDASSLSSLPAGHVEVLLGSQVTAQAPGLEMFGADSVDAADYVNAAQQNGQSVPAAAQAAASAGSASDVPAYSQSASSSASSSSSSGSGSSTPGTTGSQASTTSFTAKKTAPGSSKKKSSSSSSSPTAVSGSNPPYGLTTCPY